MVQADMHASIFDIDGTLLDSNGVDGKLYIAAVRSVLGRVRIRESWGQYRHVTDAGILDEILADNGIRSDNRVVTTIQRAFIEKLENHIKMNGPFVEIAGARDFVLSLCGAADRACAYATGA